MADSVVSMSTIELDSPAKQSVFASLVGVSQPAIHKQIEKGALERGGTYRKWLLQYSQRLRDEAANWGSTDDDDALRAAKIRDLEAGATLKELQGAEKAKELARVEELKYKFGVALDHMRSIWMNCDPPMRAMVKKDYGVDLPQGYFKTVGRDALSEVAKFVRPQEGAE